MYLLVTVHPCSRRLLSFLEYAGGHIGYVERAGRFSAALAAAGKARLAKSPLPTRDRNRVAIGGHVGLRLLRTGNGFPFNFGASSDGFRGGVAAGRVFWFYSLLVLLVPLPIAIGAAVHRLLSSVTLDFGRPLPNDQPSNALLPCLIRAREASGSPSASRTRRA